jgi:hypothetical protein
MKKKSSNCYTIKKKSFHIKSKKNNKKTKMNNNMNGGDKVKKCACIDYDKKGSIYINYEHGKKCNNNVLPGTDFCSKHQDCMKFAQTFVNNYELQYNPEEWNKVQNVKESHNCYTYFLDNKIKPLKQKCQSLIDNKKEDKCSDLKPQPGDFYLLVNTGSLDKKERNYTCKDMTEKILNDNPSIQKSKFDAKCPSGSYKGAMVVDPGNTFHFYRQNADSTWSHKPGVLNVTNTDASGDKIYFPHTANRNYKENKTNGINYTDFCGYYCIPRKGRVNIYAI